ncbi:Rv1733c family protein [Mycobacterium seoulense]|uniref:Membrane protein n=1 Tax=Mycobacterium seoulense TaxID=386911 RepID=A0A7I7NWF1_9MYCO|nr:membrane protein [Mycobacterium seoulense]
MTTPHPNCGRPTGHRSDEDTALDTFTVRLPRWRFAQLFGFNPLVRIGDRVEALVVVLAVVISVIAVPIAAAVGTVVYDSRSRQYAERAQISRVVTGTVTSLKVAYHESLGPTITVLARWVDGGTEHTGAVSAPRGVTIGDSIDIWVGEDGSHVGPPPETAGDEAVAAALLTWFGVAIAAGVLVAGTRAAFNRARHAQWQKNFDNLVVDGDGHTNQR